MSSMTIFDNRLIPSDAAPGAGPPDLAQNTFRVDGTNKLANAFQWVKDFAEGQPGKKIDTFHIMCHGIYRWAESSALQASAIVGGFGLKLCQEGLLPSTIDLIVPLVRDRLGDVLIYACGAASDQADGPQNGQVFCKMLARKLKCVVYTSDRKQVFSYSRVAPMALDFGDWEGNITRFSPDEQAATVGRFPSPNRT
jgi:hypothetical protein